MSELTHFDAGGAAHMVDVSAKQPTQRVALAEGYISMQAATLALIAGGGHKKGDVLGIARIAGIMAAKQTASLIPLCHPLSLTHIHLDFTLQAETSRVSCQAQVETLDRSGVEIEALCAVQIALLTVYDMCKAVDRGMQIEGVRLLRKAGGKSGEWVRD